MKRTSRWSSILSLWPDGIDFTTAVALVLIGFTVGVLVVRMF